MSLNEHLTERMHGTTDASRCEASGRPLELVLSTTELLENVLAHLSMRELLQAQQICRHWQAVIESSRNLQQNLYFVQMQATARPQHQFLLGIKSTFATTQSLIMPNDAPVTTLKLGTLNPLLLDRVEPLPFVGQDAASVTDTHVRFIGRPLKELDKCQSWRRMLLTQPPVTSATIVFCRGCKRASARFSAEIVRANGITAWDVMREIMESEQRLPLGDARNIGYVVKLTKFLPLEQRNMRQTKAKLHTEMLTRGFLLRNV